MKFDPDKAAAAAAASSASSSSLSQPSSPKGSPTREKQKRKCSDSRVLLNIYGYSFSGERRKSNPEKKPPSSSSSRSALGSAAGGGSAIDLLAVTEGKDYYLRPEQMD